MTQQARNLAWELSEVDVRARFLIRDGDCKFTTGFDAVLEDEGTTVIRTPPRSPLANSVAERWVGTLRREVLDWLLILDQRHLTRILKEYVEHYNRARPHRSRDLDPPAGPVNAPSGEVITISRLGGLLHEYARAA